MEAATVDKSQILISVIVPVYNVEEYLPRCLDSIISQSHKNLQIILVNDGSTDGGGAICDRYAEKDSRIQVVHKANGGLSSARNAGLDVATGDWTGFVDSDDWIEPEMYERLLGYALDSGAEIVSCGVVSHSYEGNVLKKRPVPLPENFSAGQESLKVLLSTSNYFGIAVWNKIYSHELLLKTKLRFDEKLRAAEDVLFTLEIFMRANHVCAMQYAPYHYCTRPTSIQGTVNPKRLRDTLNVNKGVIALTEHLPEDIQLIAKCNYAIKMINCLLVFSKSEGGKYLRELRKEAFRYAPVFFRSRQISLYMKLRGAFTILFPKVAYAVWNYFDKRKA
jgi:glycosyltransferase involved in cell wall biosynthesis